MAECRNCVLLSLIILSFSAVLARKLDFLGERFKTNVNAIKNHTEIDLVFLVDASSSVGEDNFASELRFVRKILSDLTVSNNHTRIALITFGSKDSVRTHINSISGNNELDKCTLLNEFLPNIEYTGGGTYTYGAFQTARQIISDTTRNSSSQAVFLITDGFSNGGSPIPIAQELKSEYNVTVFTIGIKTGRSYELENLSSNAETCYLLHGFKEFESLARRALHVDLQDGEYVPVASDKCNNTCDTQRADCTCGTGSGQYACKCRRGYYGDGVQCLSCPKGTWHRGKDGICLPCPDPNHESFKALNIKECTCKRGYRDDGKGRCEVVTCPNLEPPPNGYFVGIPLKNGVCQNVLHNACGMRCQVGYSLRGNSIRLCQENGTWTGIHPQCVIKMCARPPVPQFGNVTECVNKDLDVTYDGSDLPDDMPVDTECSFSCQTGHALTGSPSRTCLPVAQWDGLRTTCKPIRCHTLGKVQHGTWEPEICNRERQSFDSKCTLICKKGFIRSGEPLHCKSKSGRGPGKWIGTGTKCIDQEIPSIICPKNITIETDPGSPYGISQLAPPKISDNSGFDITIWADPIIIPDTIENNKTDSDSDDIIVNMWDLSAVNKFEIGITIVTYHAVDTSGNEATCNVTIEVLDKDPPQFENCDNPSPFLTPDPTTVKIEWDEPLVFDNSQNTVMLTRSKNFGIFEAGVTEVVYTATDLSNNTNTCKINITVIAEAKCDSPPLEHAVCNPLPGDSGVTCAVTCQEGYGFALTDKAICLHDSPGVWDVPECTPMENPSHIWEVFNTEAECNTSGSLIQNLGTIVEEDGGIVIISNCGEEVSNNYSRYKREIGDKKKVRKIEFRVKDNKKLLQAAEKEGVNLEITDPIATCRNGSVLAIRYPGQKIRCVLCPKGTYFSKKKCIPCPVDTFSTKPGIFSCEACPAGRTTLGRKRAKAKRACKAVCPPGTNKAKKGIICEVKPKKRLSCDKANVCKNGGTCISIGFNKQKCICSPGWYGARCRVKIKIPCLCQNNGTCDENGKCLCTTGYVGEFCELEEADLLPEQYNLPQEPIFNPCQIDKELCENNGSCVNDSLGGYFCQCAQGFIGRRCNLLPCDYKPCSLGTVCTNLVETNTTKDSFNCICPVGKKNPPECNDPINYCEPNMCQNNAKCVTNKTGYICQCVRSYYGVNCEIQKDSDYILQFPRSGINDFVIVDGPTENFDEISVCVWLQTTDKGNYGTLLSYANENFDNAFTVTDYSGLVMYVNGEHVVTDVRLNDGRWQHLCVCWRSDNGSYVIYVNSKLKVLGNGLSLGKKILGNGKFVLGQEQDTLGGRFSRSESFIGRLSNLDIWSKYLSQNDVKNIMQDCTKSLIGDIQTWSDFKNAIKGDVNIENSTFCANCSDINEMQNGTVILSEDKRTANYSCDKGHILYNPKEVADGFLLRKCTVASIWDGLENPQCKPVSCSYPGYVPNAKIVGKYYNIKYLDELVYICLEGYEPENPQKRTCQEDGTWSGIRPFCKGSGHCENFGKPIDSNISIASEHDYEEDFQDIKAFAPGTQIEINCLNDVELIGEPLVTCLENGTWDNEIPLCQSPGCLANDLSLIPANSYSLNEISGVIFDIATTINFKCRNGHIQQGLNYTQCLPNGKWTPLNLTCNPVKCQEPPLYDNMIYKNGYNITQYYFGNMLKYECIEGYVFYGVSTIRCLANGKWNKVKGKCARISCNKPNVKPGETVIGSSYLYKDSLSVLCPDSSPVSQYIMKCSSSGNWLQIGNC